MTDQNHRIRIKRGEVEIEVEGDKEFVEKHIEEFKKEIPNIAKELSPKEKLIPPQEVSPEENELEGLSLAEFYKQKQPKDFNETAVVFAYWLTKKEGKEEFKASDIGACYDEVRMPKPKNITQHILALASGKKAQLAKGSKKGYYKLTSTGKDFVKKELPRKSEEKGEE
ncbi:MAG: hypothetical protein SVE93_04825 [Candidatus Thermoplasmatota archaeon]|nr:hypothetical protein [Candidatus Thermoplasmatota archaeon]